MSAEERIDRLLEGADRGIGMTMLHRIIVGSFKSAADAHNGGKVPDWIASGAKRAASGIAAELTNPDGG